MHMHLHTHISIYTHMLADLVLPFPVNALDGIITSHKCYYRDITLNSVISKVF